MKLGHKIKYLILGLILILGLTSCNLNSADKGLGISEQTENKKQETKTQTEAKEVKSKEKLDPDLAYTSLEDVALFLHQYGKLPKNYIKKSKAYDLGWDPQEGNLWDVADKMIIGGDSFGNREGKLPKEKNRKYFEADINYQGGRRGAERLIYSNDGLIYYTKDHYNTFELLYDKEGEK